MLRKGSLLDYLNVPTTVAGNSFSSNFNVAQFDSNNSTVFASSLYRVSTINSTIKYGGISNPTTSGFVPSVASTSQYPQGVSAPLSLNSSALVRANSIDSFSSAFRNLNLDFAFDIGKSFTYTSTASPEVLSSAIPTSSAGNREVKYVNHAMHYYIEDSDLIKDSSLFFTITLPRWTRSGTNSVYTDLGRRFADILAKGSHVYLGASASVGNVVAMEIMYKFDFSSIAVTHGDLESKVTLTMPLSAEMYDALMDKQVGGHVRVSLNFVTLPIMGNLSYSTTSSGIISEPISNLAAGRDFGYMLSASSAAEIDSDVIGFVLLTFLLPFYIFSAK